MHETLFLQLQPYLLEYFLIKMVFNWSVELQFYIAVLINNLINAIEVTIFVHFFFF